MTCSALSFTENSDPEIDIIFYFNMHKPYFKIVINKDLIRIEIKILRK